MGKFYGYPISSGYKGRIDEETNEFMVFATEDEYVEYVVERSEDDEEDLRMD